MSPSPGVGRAECRDNEYELFRSQDELSHGHTHHILSEDASRLMVTKGEDPAKLSAGEAFEIAKKYVMDELEKEAGGPGPTGYHESQIFQDDPDQMVKDQLAKMGIVGGRTRQLWSCSSSAGGICSSSGGWCACRGWHFRVSRSSIHFAFTISSRHLDHRFLHLLPPYSPGQRRLQGSRPGSGVFDPRESKSGLRWGSVDLAQ